MVLEPTAEPETDAVKLPFVSVIPVVGVNRMPPVPALVNVTVCPGSAAPAPDLTLTVSVADVPPATSVDAVDVTVTVVPKIDIGICVERPLAVAVIVAVRVATLAVPEEKVTVALPVASLVAELAERKPVSAEKVIGTPAIAAFDESVTVAVIVVDALLSAGTLSVDADTLIAFATGVVGPVGVVFVEFPPPPQAAKVAMIHIETNVSAARIRKLVNMCSYYFDMRIRASIVLKFRSDDDR